MTAGPGGSGKAAPLAGDSVTTAPAGALPVTAAVVLGLGCGDAIGPPVPDDGAAELLPPQAVASVLARITIQMRMREPLLPGDLHAKKVHEDLAIGFVFRILLRTPDVKIDLLRRRIHLARDALLARQRIVHAQRLSVTDALRDHEVHLVVLV